MIYEEITACASLRLTLPTLPRRSDLHSQKPIGVGTGLVESLSGYLMRLAETHGVSASLLFKEVLFPKMQSFYPTAQQRSNRADFVCINAANGIGIIASDFVRALEALTLQNGLSYLTMLTWSNVLPVMKLVRTARAWCPSCYEEWYEREDTIYEPLLWSLEAISFCPAHKRWLNHNCRTCGRKQPLSAGYSRPGFCAYCRRWMGSFDRADDEVIPSESDVEEHTWFYKAAGEILSAPPSLRALPQRDTLLAALRSVTTHFPHGNAKLGKILKIHCSAICQWVRGISRPQLYSLLRLSHGTRISASSFLLGEDIKEDIKIDPNSLVGVCLRSTICKKHPVTRRGKIINWKKVLPKLETAQYQYPPPSIKDLTMQLAKEGLLFKPESIQRNMPEIYQLLRERYAAYKKVNYLREVRCLLQAELESDQYPPPSMNEVSKRIAKHLGCKKATFLYRRFAPLCHQIAERYRKYLADYRKQRKVQIHNQIRSEAIKLHASGIYPSRIKVNRNLKSSFRWTDEEVECLSKVRHELGPIYSE